jgi:hypothetical protein
MPPRRRALLAGLAVLALTALMLPWNPTRGCGERSATPPIIAFELALDRDDLLAVFGAPGPCRDALVSDLRIVDGIDYAFMLAYGTMLVAALAALGARRRLLGVAVMAPIADAIENLALFSIDLDSPGGWLAVLAVAARAKFVLLGIASCAIAIYTWRGERGRKHWFALAHAPALPLAIAGVTLPAAAALLTPAFAVSWFAVVVWAALPTRPAPRSASDR